MKTTTLLSFVYDDGTVSMHVTATQYSERCMVADLYTVSHHNTLDGVPSDVARFLDKSNALKSGEARIARYKAQLREHLTE